MAANKKGTNQPMLMAGRRPSLETMTKTPDYAEHLLEEMRKLQQETNQEIQSSREDVKEKLRLELGEISTRLDKIDGELNVINGKIKNLELDVRKSEIKMETLSKEQEENQDAILKIQMKQRENCLKLRGLPEKANENLYTFLCPILAKFIEESEEHFPWEVDRAYRISSRVAKLKNLPRDVVIYFVRKQTRDLILQKSYKANLVIDDNKILILKDIPPKILKKRRDYLFLTELLKNHKIPFRWEEIEGLVVFWNQKNIRLNSPEKARLFMNGLKKDLERKERDRGGGEGEKITVID